MFFFRYFPYTNYDIKRNGNNQIVVNMLSRFKIVDILKSRSAIYYQYSVKEDETASAIANKYYKDPSLDWLIYLTNQIQDPLSEWPMSYTDFIEFIKSKYGSVAAAQSSIRQYEWIKRVQTVTVDGTVIPEEILVVDLPKYNTIDPTERQIIYEYDYQVRENDRRRNIKLLDKKYLSAVTNQLRRVFS